MSKYCTSSLLLVESGAAAFLLFSATKHVSCLQKHTWTCTYLAFQNLAYRHVSLFFTNFETRFLVKEAEEM